MILYKNRDNEFRIRAEYSNAKVTSGKLYFKIFTSQSDLTEALKTITFDITSYDQIINITKTNITNMTQGTYYYEMDMLVNSKLLPIENGNLTIEDRSEITIQGS